jgi:hypothetical protein
MRCIFKQQQFDHVRLNCTALSLVSRIHRIALVTVVNISNRARGALDQLELGQLARIVLLRCYVLNTVSR